MLLSDLLKQLQACTDEKEKEKLIKLIDQRLQLESELLEKHMETFRKESQLLSEQRIPPPLDKLWRCINY